MYLVNNTQYSTSPAHIIDGDDTVCKIIKRVNLDNWDYVEARGNTPICKKCSPKQKIDKSDLDDWSLVLDAIKDEVHGAVAELAIHLQLRNVYMTENPVGMEFYIPVNIAGICSVEALNEIHRSVETVSSVKTKFYITNENDAIANKLFPKSKPAKNKTYTEKSEEFLKSREWRELRYEVLQKYGAKCMCCGAVKGGEVYICVDHIKPRYKYPDLKLEFDNLQVLCNECNHGKGAHDETDYRHTQQDEQATVTVDADGTININITITVKGR